MEEILTEQGFQQTGCTSDECVVEVGKIVGVQQMVGGSISKVGNVFSVSARIVNVETGVILQMATYDYEGKIGELLKVGMQKVASMLVEGEMEYAETVKAFGTLYISSDPAGASVWIDDTKQDGVTPVLVDKQRAGEHKIYVEKGDLSALTIERVEANVVKKVNLTLGFATGSVNVFSDPIEADVLLDGKKAGVTPLTIEDLKTGEHTLEVKIPDYVQFIEKIVIKKNQTEQVVAHLKKMPFLSLFSDPINAKVIVDGQQIGYTPIVKYMLEPGIHSIDILKSDYEKYSTTVELEPGGETEITPSLIRKMGGLEIKTFPPGADIFLNDELKGKTPLTISKIPTGLYRIKAKSNGYLSYEKEIRVEHKKTLGFHFNLISVKSVKDKILTTKRNRNLWVYLSLASSAIGGYFKYSSYAHYQEYKTAGPEAGELHKKIDRDNVIYPVAFGIGVVCTLPAIYQHWKKENLETKLSHEQD